MVRSALDILKMNNRFQGNEGDAKEYVDPSSAGNQELTNEVDRLKKLLEDQDKLKAKCRMIDIGSLQDIWPKEFASDPPLNKEGKYLDIKTKVEVDKLRDELSDKYGLDCNENDKKMLVYLLVSQGYERAIDIVGIKVIDFKYPYNVRAATKLTMDNLVVELELRISSRCPTLPCVPTSLRSLVDLNAKLDQVKVKRVRSLLEKIERKMDTVDKSDCDLNSLLDYPVHSNKYHVQVKFVVNFFRLLKIGDYEEFESLVEVTAKFYQFTPGPLYFNNILWKLCYTLGSKHSNKVIGKDFGTIELKSLVEDISKDSYQQLVSLNNKKDKVRYDNGYDERVTGVKKQDNNVIKRRKIDTNVNKRARADPSYIPDKQAVGIPDGKEPPAEAIRRNALNSWGVAEDWCLHATRCTNSDCDRKHVTGVILGRADNVRNRYYRAYHVKQLPGGRIPVMTDAEFADQVKKDDKKADLIRSRRESRKTSSR